MGAEMRDDRKKEKENQTMALSDVSVPERLWYYMGMVYSGNGVWVWCYSENGELYYSSSPYEKELDMFFTAGGCRAYAMETGKTLNGPFIMSSSVGMVWLGEFAAIGDERRLILIGPVFFGTASSRSVENALTNMNLSVEIKRLCMKILRDVPVVGGDIFWSLGRMLHYMITLEDARNIEIPCQYLETGNSSGKHEKDAGGVSYERMREQEELILQCVRDGNRNYSQAFATIGKAGSDRFHSGDEHRDAVNKMIIFTSQCARAAIEGGVTPKIALELEEKYIRAAEEPKTLPELMQLNKQMLDDFIARVNESREICGVSPVIRECCIYIREHVTDELTLAGIAKQMGYAEYYLARKFAREMGEKMLDYIKDQRIEYARIWLATTNKTVQDICDSLHFGSRSYFSRMFKEKLGMSPAAYREKIQKYSGKGE